MSGNRAVHEPVDDAPAVVEAFGELLAPPMVMVAVARPGDALVLFVDDDMPSEHAKRIAEQLSEHLGERLDLDVVIVNGVKGAVVVNRPETAEFVDEMATTAPDGSDG